MPSPWADVPILSVRQPWAWAIVNGHKDVENRTWRTQHRGTLLIHASTRMDSEVLPDFTRWAARSGLDLPTRLPRGAIVGSVRVSDVVRCSSSPWAEDESWHWLLSDAQALNVGTSVHETGALMLFRRPDAATLAGARLRRQDAQRARV